MRELPEELTGPKPPDGEGRGWRTLGPELRSIESIKDFVRTVTVYGWGPPLVALVIHGAVRGVFEHLTDPFIISAGYWFVGWQFALFVNFVYGTAIVVFSWFLYFGLVGSLAGYLSSERHMDVGIFKVGAYLSLLFVPVFLVGWIIALTLSVPEGVTVGTTQAAAQSYVRDTLQLRVVAFLKGLTWILIGLVLLPIVSDRYSLGRKGSVLAVLPPTMAAILATQLI